MFFLRQLKKLNWPQAELIQVCTAMVQSILTSSVTVWYSAATKLDNQRLQCIIHSTEEIISC